MSLTEKLRKLVFGETKRNDDFLDRIAAECANYNSGKFGNYKSEFFDNSFCTLTGDVHCVYRGNKPIQLSKSSYLYFCNLYYLQRLREDDRKQKD